jgi:hypothetical protein
MMQEWSNIIDAWVALLILPSMPLLELDPAVYRPHMPMPDARRLSSGNAL